MVGPTQILKAAWPAPTGVLAGTSTRTLGVSKPPYDSNNMGLHVGDSPAAVMNNRQQLADCFSSKFTWQWLNQTHSVRVASVQCAGEPLNADAVYTNVPNIMCCVMTADCLPVFITNRAGTEVAMVHAGWRGLAAGIIENTIAEFHSSPQQLLAHLGPAIGPCHFEVEADVLDEFSASMADIKLAQFFKRQSDKKYLADLFGLAQAKLRSVGLTDYSGGEHCTVCESEHYFSFRRDGVTGRMVNYIGISS